MRKEKNRTRTTTQDEQDGVVGPIDDRHDIEAVLLEQERDKAICSAVNALPPRDRQVYELLYSKGMAPEDAARALGVSVAVLYTRKHRLIEKIKKTFTSL
jgi:RNA polymerase sigma factor (sigma-70 family)